MKDDDGQLDWLARPKTTAEQVEEWRELYDDGTYDPWFWRWLPDNMHILTAFRRIALVARRAGRKRWGTSVIVGQIRWESTLREGGQDNLKINENAKPWLARMAMNLEPELAGFFKTRETGPHAGRHGRRLIDGKLYSEPLDDDEDEDEE